MNMVPECESRRHTAIMYIWYSTIITRERYVLICQNKHPAS